MDSRLYLDKMADNLSGKNLYTASELLKIKNYISDTYTAYAYDRASGQQVEFIKVSIWHQLIFPECLIDFSGSILTEAFGK